MERLRDLAAAGGVDDLYVHAPDRLARKYAYQVLLLEEFAQAGVRVAFLTRPHGQSPEDDLLLQVQGMVAEYERARFLERSRRGKRHAARSGAVSVLTGAPYGYRYVGKAARDGQARYEVVPDEARTVRQLFEWVGRERVSLAEAARRLAQAGARTRTGRTRWDHSVVWDMLKNPAYIGQAAYGKTRRGPWEPPPRPFHGRPFPPRKAVTTRGTPPEEWLRVPVPALVPEALFAAVQDQLAENRRRRRQSPQGVRYLLQGLLVCAQCGYAFYGKTVVARSAGGTPPREHAYYRCSGTDRARFGGTRRCSNVQLRTDRVDAAVWQEVRALLEQPERVAQEYRRRLETATRPGDDAAAAAASGQAATLRQGLARLIDGYAEGLLEKAEFEPRLARLRERIARLEAEAQRQADEARLQRELTLVIGRVEAFAQRVAAGLAEAGWSQRREILQALVKRVEVDRGQATVVFRIDPGPPPGASRPNRWQDPGGLVHARGLQGDVALAQPLEPVAQGQQLARHRPERARVPPDGPVVLRQQHARHHAPLVHIQAAAPPVDNPHGHPPPDAVGVWPRGGAEHSQLSPACSPRRSAAGTATVIRSWAHPGQLGSRAPGTERSPTWLTRPRHEGASFSSLVHARRGIALGS